jgi:hypothetical protein
LRHFYNTRSSETEVGYRRRFFTQENDTISKTMATQNMYTIPQALSCLSAHRFGRNARENTSPFVLLTQAFSSTKAMKLIVKRGVYREDLLVYKSKRLNL